MSGSAGPPSGRKPSRSRGPGPKPRKGRGNPGPRNSAEVTSADAQADKRPRAPGQPARHAAALALTAILENQQMLSTLTAATSGPFADLSATERARAGSIVTGVLRLLSRIDHTLAPRLRKRPPAAVLQPLRIATWELLADGVPDYAAVDGAVKQVRGSAKTRHLAPLANAVARGLTRDGRDDWESAGDPALPGWLTNPIARDFGKSVPAAIAAAHAAAPPLDLSLRDSAPAAAAALIATLTEAGLTAEILPTGSVRLRGQWGAVSALPGFATGGWWVQDAAAAMPVRLLGDLAGKRVLDLCAAPGGKTLQLAAAGAQVTAIDSSADRLERLTENLARTGLSAEVVTSDVRDWSPAEPVDVIVLDAPCSASGTLRRHPDLPHVRPNPDLRPLLKLQADLLDRAVEMLAPGGLLLYCTCSLFTAEGEAQASAALDRHETLARAGLPPMVPGLDPAWVTDQGDLRLRPDFWPDLGGMDGFFATVLRKQS